MIYLFLANGFEEVEALAPLDILRRAGLDIKTVGVGGNTVTGSHGITVVCDFTTEQVDISDSIEAVIIPGGMPGTLNLENDDTVNRFIDFAYNNDKYICAICAAPSILGHKGMLNGREAICFPGYEKDLTGAKISEKYVVRDGKIITARGMGVATEFGLEIAAAFVGKEKADSIKKQIQSL